jgi:hypothetical protein
MLEEEEEEEEEKEIIVPRNRYLYLVSSVHYLHLSRIL